MSSGPLLLPRCHIPPPPASSYCSADHLITCWAAHLPAIAYFPLQTEEGTENFRTTEYQVRDVLLFLFQTSPSSSLHHHLWTSIRTAIYDEVSCLMDTQCKFYGRVSSSSSCWKKNSKERAASEEFSSLAKGRWKGTGQNRGYCRHKRLFVFIASGWVSEPFFAIFSTILCEFPLTLRHRH